MIIVVRLSVFYGASLEFETQLIQFESIDSPDAIRARARSIVERWLMKNSYPLDEWGYSLNFFNSSCKEDMDLI